MQLHVQSLSEGPEEVRYEFGSMIGCDMFGYSVLGEDVLEEQLRESGGVERVVRRNEYRLLSEPVDDNQDVRKSVGLR